MALTRVAGTCIALFISGAVETHSKTVVHPVLCVSRSGVCVCFRRARRFSGRAEAGEGGASESCTGRYRLAATIIIPTNGYVAFSNGPMCHAGSRLNDPLARLSC